MIRLFILLAFCSAGLFSQTNTAFVYAPDSSALSILFDNAKIDITNSSFTLDLKDKWTYKKRDSIRIDIRGGFMANGKQETGQGVIFVFGKKENIEFKTSADTFTFFRSIKDYKKNSFVIVKWRKKPSRKKVKIFAIDSFDFRAIRKI